VVWIFAAIAVLLMFAPPAMRNLGLGILGAVLVVFLVIVILNRRPLAPTASVVPPAAIDAGARSRQFDFDTYEREKKDREDPEAAGRVAVSELRFGEVRSMPGLVPGTLEAVRARLYNDSVRFTLTDYSYALVVQDCLPSQPTAAQESTCNTVFDRHGWASAIVPANQARDVVIEIPNDPATHAPPFVLLGTPRVELTATGTRAYQGSQPR
jgi:hypothetical protein